MISFFFFQAEDGIRDYKVTGVQTCALPIWGGAPGYPAPRESRKSTGPPRSALRHGAAGSRARGGGGARARARHRGRGGRPLRTDPPHPGGDRESTRLNSRHLVISYAVFCFKKKK